MFLTRIYSLPDGLFPEVEFKNGVNFIYGKKGDNNPKASLNSIGKSTFLDLIDFCLLASFTKSHNPRLYAAKAIMSGYDIVLEFTVGDTSYVLKRSVDDPKIAYFGNNYSLQKYTLDHLKIILGQIVFQKPFSGVFNPKWFRLLMSFYLKIQKHGRSQFLDPIKYMRDVNESETNIYQLYLLGIDNRLAVKNQEVRTALKKIKPAIKEINKLIREKYDLKNLEETNKKINELKHEIHQFETAIDNFRLKEEYHDVEKEADKLTQTIKDKWFQNFADRKRIEAYNDSFRLTESISPTRIKNIYEELSKEFASIVKKTLADAVNFRKELSESRKFFLEKEISSLTEAISLREKEIEELETNRAKLFKFLSAQEAIKDLTEAFNIISEKKSQLDDLNSSTRILNDLQKEKLEIEEEIMRVTNETFKFITEIHEKTAQFYSLFTEIYDEIYMEEQDKSAFSIAFNRNKERLLDINISMPDMYGDGKNIGRTLVYDLFVLLNSQTLSNVFPKFIIHDGIFDGVDKAHFIAVYEYIEKLVSEKGMQIQYIATLNEEGTLSDKFGNAEKVVPEKVEKEAILILSPERKLFRQDFKA